MLKIIDKNLADKGEFHYWPNWNSKTKLWVSKEVQTTSTVASDEDNKRIDDDKDRSPQISIGSIDKAVKHMPTELPFGTAVPIHSLTRTIDSKFTLGTSGLAKIKSNAYLITYKYNNYNSYSNQKARFQFQSSVYNNELQ